MPMDFQFKKPPFPLEYKAAICGLVRDISWNHPSQKISNMVRTPVGNTLNYFPYFDIICDLCKAMQSNMVSI